MDPSVPKTPKTGILKSLRKKKVKKQNPSSNNSIESPQLNEIKQTNKEKNNQKFIELVKEKIVFFKKIVESITIHINNNKILGVLDSLDVINGIDSLTTLKMKLEAIEEINVEKDEIVEILQQINNDLSTIIKKYGIIEFSNLIKVCIGENNLRISPEYGEKWNLLLKFFHPISYSYIIIKNLVVGVSEESQVDTQFTDFECISIHNEYKNFFIQINGLKVDITLDNNNKLVIYGYIDNIIPYLISSDYILSKKNMLANESLKISDLEKDVFDQYINTITIKEHLINDTFKNYYNEFISLLKLNESFKEKQIINIVKEFTKDDLFNKRKTIISLLIKKDRIENEYLCYLLYDLISNESNGIVDTKEQTSLYDSLPLSIKNKFKAAMKKTIEYTSSLSNIDSSKIPLEQQICLMNTNDTIKEKAMVKLKEVKSKSDDGGSKARAYLEGLLKIPFNIFKKEPILYEINKMRELFINLRDTKNKYIKVTDSTSINSLVIINSIKGLMPIIKKNITSKQIYSCLVNELCNLNTDELEKFKKFAKIIVSEGDFLIKFPYRKVEQKKNIINYLSSIENKDKYYDLLFYFDYNMNTGYNYYFKNIVKKLDFFNNYMCIKKSIFDIQDYLKYVENTLDNCVYSHNNAKKQVVRIIGQWMNGDGESLSASVLGFEGNPGVGKTTLAKGLAKCLLDENKEERPLSIIAIGGDANASSLVGHSYTYVGSTWGQIVQILMEKKCMNPIIVIDELDKISKTEQGKEIIGILTHLLDPSQNKNFQDKYFTGIPLDLSKVLFILSYNNVEALDKIMLDRIQRIRFENLSVEDKLVVAKKHLLPEICGKFGLTNMFEFPDETLKYIIEFHTLEPGVRKLKEKLYNIVAEVNLNILNLKEYNIPIIVSIDDVKNNYFKEVRTAKKHKVHLESQVGLINALWANDMGQGGVLPLQARFVPNNKFLGLVLTGSLGDVMKESITVSLTNAWHLTPQKQKDLLIKKYNNAKEDIIYGIHIHCPSISVKKDGPSATTAFTVLLYSLFNDKKIKHNFGITGETSFDYKLTEIGGLREKIIFSIPSGITDFIYPEENTFDFKKIQEKYKDDEIIKGIQFHCITEVEDVLKIILD